MESEKGVSGVSIFGNLLRPSWAVLFLSFALIAVVSLQLPSMTVFPALLRSVSSEPSLPEGHRSCSGYFHGGVRGGRKFVMSIKDFGGVGDGKTSNTETFRRAIRYMQRFGDKGGSQLIIPKGRWLTGSFNLTSNFTLFLEEDAVILGSQVRTILSVLVFFLSLNLFLSGLMCFILTMNLVYI